ARGDPQPDGEGLPEVVPVAVRIAVDPGGGVPYRLDRPRGGTERILVAGQLDHLAQSELSLGLLDRLPGNVRGDPENMLGHADLHEASCSRRISSAVRRRHSPGFKARS